MISIDEFRFPCFVDICTFPYQYCNSDADERRCNYCTVPICTSDFIPDPCKYYCKSLSSTKTPTTTTLPLSAGSVTSSSICSEATPHFPIYAWTIIVLTVLIAALLTIVIILLVSRRKNSKLPTDERMEQGEKQEFKPLIKPSMNEPDSASDCSDLPDGSLSSTSCSGPISQPEDSLHGNGAASPGPPPYTNESTEKSKETLQEHQKCTKSKISGPIQRQCSRSTTRDESECSSNPTLPLRGDLCDSSLFVSSSEGHIPQRNHCCRELDSRKSDK